MKLHHIALVCGSEESSDRFYRELLGLEKQTPKQVSAAAMNDFFKIDTGAQLINYVGENLWFEIFISDTVEQTPISHHCLCVADRSTFLEKCTASNVAVRKIKKNDGRLLVFISDDSHNQFEIKESEA